MSAWTRLRDGQVHTSPWVRANAVNPSSALSRKSSWALSTSEKKMLGLLPPSSRVTGIRFCDAYCMISRPVVVSPVNAILAIRLLDASGLPASAPNPLTTLTTPGGSRSPISDIRYSTDAGVGSAGLSTAALPAASAGASFQVAIRIGKFHGMICPTTPSGSGEGEGVGVFVDFDTGTP